MPTLVSAPAHCARQGRAGVTLAPLTRSPFPRCAGALSSRPSTSTSALFRSATALAPPPTPSWIPYLSLGAGTYCAALALLMAVAPGAPLTRALAGAPPAPGKAAPASRRLFPRELALLPPALAYLALLAASWTPDTLAVLLPGSLAAGLSAGWRPQFFPCLSGVAYLFARPPTAASLAVHLAGVGLLAAREAYLRGLEEGDRRGGRGERRGWARVGASRLAQAVTVLLLAFVGPLGLAVQVGVDGVRRVWRGG